MRPLIGVAAALVALGTAACGGERTGSSAGDGERVTTLIVRSIERMDAGGVTSEALRAVDPGTGTSRKLAARKFVGGDAQFAMIYTRGRLVFRCASGACVLDPDVDGPQRPLGEAWCMAPSQTDGRVWLATLDPESPETVRAMKSVSELSAEGEITAPESRLPHGRWHCPLGAVRSGLLFAERSDRIVVWSPREGRVVASVSGFPAATYADLVAWCPLKCEHELHLTDVRTGEDEVVRLEDPFLFEESYEGAFSPDGSMLAVPVRHEGLTGDRRVALVDVGSRNARVVQAMGGAGPFVWSWDGGELFTVVGRATLAAYDVSSDEFRRIPVDPPMTIVSLVGG